VLKDVRTDDLAAHPMRVLKERNASVDWDRLDDVIYGCANQAGEDNRNVARMAALLAGLPDHVSGSTINRLCGSGLDAVGSAARAIRAGDAELMIAGGVESMTRAPFVMLKPPAAWSREVPAIADSTVGWRFINPRMKAEWTISLGATAEKVAAMYGITREDQDRWALESQQRAARAVRDRLFDEEIVEVQVGGPGAPRRVDRDEHPRPDATFEKLSTLKPAFARAGTVTAWPAAGQRGSPLTLTAPSAGRSTDLPLPV
jgi:acetyl-CoA acetyltransferase family protein